MSKALKRRIFVYVLVAILLIGSVIATIKSSLSQTTGIVLSAILGTMFLAVVVINEIRIFKRNKK